ncbi:MAG: biotin--[acetyl-CoA-carboxylase] ligase [Candidatus Eisenbacteria bacterium]
MTAAAPESLGFAPGQVLSGPVDLRLDASLVGCRVHYLPSVGSTNAVLRSLAEDGEPEGAVVVADEQTAGRGRAGRSWFSPRGKGLWLSVLLKPLRPAIDVAPLSMVTAVSVAAVLRRDFGVDARVKWPNDLVAGGRKLGGILLESLQGAGGAVERVVVGIGLNVNLDARDVPSDIAGTATSLRMLLGMDVSRLDVLRSVLDAFDEDWRKFESDGVAGFLERWRGLSTVLGRRIEIATDGEPGAGDARANARERLVAGTAVDITPEGALVVEDGAGRRVQVWHGDVVTLE